MNENLKSYDCNYKIEYEVEVNPYTKVDTANGMPINILELLNL